MKYIIFLFACFLNNYMNINQEKRSIALEFIGDSDKPIPKIIISNYNLVIKNSTFCYYLVEDDFILTKIWECAKKYEKKNSAGSQAPLYKIVMYYQNDSNQKNIIINNKTEIIDFFNCIQNISFRDSLKQNEFNKKINNIKIRLGD